MKEEQEEKVIFSITEKNDGVEIKSEAVKTDLILIFSDLISKSKDFKEIMDMAMAYSKHKETELSTIKTVGDA